MILLEDFTNVSLTIEDNDGDVYLGITSPWESAFPEETVMAYRNPLKTEWPDFYSNNDLNALKIYGTRS